MKTQSIIRSALIAIIATGSAITVAAPALAEDVTSQVHVGLGHFDLSDAAGQKAVERKIRLSAIAVCPGLSSSELGERLEARRCIAAAVKSANDQLASLQASHGTALAALDTKTGAALSK